MYSNAKYEEQNELITQERVKASPRANFEEFSDEENLDEIDGGAENIPLRGIEDRKPEITHGNGTPLRPTPDRGLVIPNGYFPQWPSAYPASPDNIPSLNLFQQKKTIAQGMLDLALLSANANQLRYILEYKERNHYYYVSLTLISLSLVLQVLVAIALVFKSRYNIDNEQEYLNADRINNFITMGILFITIINVFTSAFGVMPPQVTNL